MYKYLIAIITVLFLSGCITAGIVKEKISDKVLEVMEKDLRAGYDLAMANIEILGEDDAWGKCYLKIADGIKRVGGVKTEGGLLFTLAMKVHILERMKAGLEEDAKAACGAVFFDIMLNAAEKLPGR